MSVRTHIVSCTLFSLSTDFTCLLLLKTLIFILGDIGERKKQKNKNVLNFGRYLRYNGEARTKADSDVTRLGQMFRSCAMVAKIHCEETFI